VFDTLHAARALMGTSLGFHIVFAALGIGIPVLLCIAEGLWLRTGDPMYRDLAVRWGKVAAVLFAIGAVSGTVLSFEFGLLWPRFMDFAGAVIGFPFALEGFAFFTEAIFLGLYLFGWDRLSPRTHWLCTFPIIISSAASAFFVVSVNAWMNTPGGFDVANGVVTSVRPVDAMFTKAMPTQVAHATMSSYMATAFGVAGIYALAMLRGDRSRYNRHALSIALAVAIVASVLQVVSGDFAAKMVAHQQPVKFAAMEGQWQTEKGAPLRIGGYPDPGDRTTRYAIEIPKALSFLGFYDFNHVVRGLDEFPRDQQPDPRLVHFPFQIMVGVGFFMLAAAAWFWIGVYLRKRIEPEWWLLAALAVCMVLGFVAIEMGWFVTEFGRQPYVVQDVMRTSEAVTPREGVWVLLVLFSSIYVALTAGLALLLLRQRGYPRPEQPPAAGEAIRVT